MLVQSKHTSLLWDYIKLSQLFIYRHVVQHALVNVVLRLKRDCGDYFSPIGAYTRVIGSKVVTLTTLTSNTLVSLLNDWEQQNLLGSIEPKHSFGTNYLRGLEN